MIGLQPHYLDDLDERGMLDETLVVFLTEFGRTPKINKNAGRDHYPSCYSVAFAGAGIQGGQVYGKSDKSGSEPAENACGPADLHALFLKRSELIIRQQSLTALDDHSL